MTSTLRTAALAALLLLGCDGDPPATPDSGPDDGDAGSMMEPDAGSMMGTDAGPPITPDMNAAMRLEAANDRVRAATCACDMTPFESAMACEEFQQIDEADTCEQNAFSDHFGTVGGFFTCFAQITEDLADCYEAAGCDETAQMACDSAADSASTGCPTVPDAEAMAYQATLAACIDSMVVGPAGTCPDDTGAVSTTGDAVFTGSTVGAGDDLEAPAGCITVAGGGGAPDRAFRWTAPSAGDFTFDTLGSSYDTVLYVLSGCDGATSLGCNDDLSDMDLRSSVTATLEMDQEVLVVVEGFAAQSAGDFVINIEPAAAP